MPCVGTPRLDCRDRLVVRTLRCGRSNPGSNPGHGILKQFFFFFFFLPQEEKKSGLNRDLNPGPLAPKARIIPLDHWASCRTDYNWKDINEYSCKVICMAHIHLAIAIMNASIAQWQSVGLVNQRSWVQSSLEATNFDSTQKKIFWPRRDSNTQPSDLESDALPLRHGVKLFQVPPRFELGSLDSKSRVLTITPWNPGCYNDKIVPIWLLIQWPIGTKRFVSCRVRTGDLVRVKHTW